MSSTSQPFVGRKLSHKQLTGEWLRHNRGHYVQISQNAKSPQARYLSVCLNAPKNRKEWLPAVEAGSCCSAHLKAVGKTREEMEIVSVDLNHTCGGDPEAKERKRNYSTKDISCVSDVASAYEPTRSKEGNAKQFIGMTKTVTGFELKKGQASAAIRKLSHDTLEAQIGQYMLLPSVFDAYGEVDPEGTYKLESYACPWDNSKRQFKRCYVRLSMVGHFWDNAGIDMWICDGTFAKLKGFHHIILIAVTFDANNQMITLAFCIVDVENADNWVYFKELLEDDFPGAKVWMSDADKGIRSEAFTLSSSQSSSQTGETLEKSRCVQHMTENCRENCTGTMNEEQKNLINELAKARTERVYQLQLEAVRNENEQWADWLDERKDEFATCVFLRKGIRRHGKATSNGVENINGALKPERGLPIMHVVQGIIDCQRKKHCERKELADTLAQEGKLSSEWAESEDADIKEEAAKRRVECIQRNHPIYKANASVTSSSWSTGFVEVTVNVEEHTSTCPCLYNDEVGMNCLHVKALLLQLGPLGVGVDWFDKRHHAATYQASYSGDVPSMSLVGKLQHDSSFLPPEHKQKAGRPKKKRKPRAHRNKTEVKRICKACGKPGHFASGCRKPSTEHRVDKFKDKAILYCKRLEEECNNIE